MGQDERWLPKWEAVSLRGGLALFAASSVFKAGWTVLDKKSACGKDNPRCKGGEGEKKSSWAGVSGERAWEGQSERTVESRVWKKWPAENTRGGNEGFQSHL